MTDNAAWGARRAASIPRGISPITPIFADRAENAELWDTEGRRFVDFAAGIAVVNTGHRHPKIMARVNAQLDRFTHTAFQVIPYDSYVELAEQLNELAPGPTPKKTMFLSAGAEAIENAVKIARAHTGRPALIAFNGGFHGRTLMTMGLTGKMAPYKNGFGPFPANIFHVPYPMEQHGVSVEDSLQALDSLFKVELEPEKVAAIVIEPVQGEGGFYIAPFEFLRKLREICDAHGILMIVDEVQSGFARTGRMFAIEHAGVEPDLIAIAKGLAGGFPLSGVIGKADIMDAPTPGSLGGTYAGSPVSCAAALGVLDVIREENLCQRSEEIGQRLVARLRSFAERNDMPAIGDVRNLGAMVAFELVTSRGSNEPSPDAAKALCAKALEHGLVLLSCGVFGNVIRILVPLTASDAILDEGLEMIEKSLVEMALAQAAA